MVMTNGKRILTIPCNDPVHGITMEGIVSDAGLTPACTILPCCGELIGALLHVPAKAILRRIVRQLNAAGFEDITAPHTAVLRFPGPDRDRPSVLAERAGISKQAMNRLLGSLEISGI